MLILKRLILKLERKKEKEVFESGKHAADSDHGNDFFPEHCNVPVTINGTSLHHFPENVEEM